jgi:hypothetical protein
MDLTNRISMLEKDNKFLLSPNKTKTALEFTSLLSFGSFSFRGGKVAGA